MAKAKPGRYRRSCYTGPAVSEVSELWAFHVTGHPLPYTIRLMEPGDVPAVITIERASFPTPWHASSFLYELRHNTRSFFYTLLKPASQPSPDELADAEQGWLRRLRGVLRPPDEHRVIGYVGLRSQSTDAHISTIAVHPEWRDRGLGELLLLTAMEKAVELDAGTVSLEVRPSNQVAQHLYRKYGFRFTGVHRGYYQDGEDAWLMSVRLRQDMYLGRLAELRCALEARLSLSGDGVGQNNGDKL
jgi:ribosomal-protein-alanine N-acetyltransferase